ncbi:MAG TPA: ABC transporter substrate-binding protein [Gaiellaceae bacterium]|nr:ABC transporter substrate-binding protein [Gaiellaceae bacterium]
MSRRFLLAALVVLVSVLVAGCGGGSKSSEKDEEGGSGGAKKKVTLQLKWVTQAQFAGYYAAKAKGYYDEEGLDVNLKVGGPSITPEQVVLGKQAEFGIDWLPSLLAARDTGQDLVNIAQVFGKSGMTELTWKDSNITSISQMRGKKVGVWCCGNENELYAALNKNGMDPKKDVTIVNQPFNMDLFLKRQVDAAAAMTYNELAQVLETQNPKTGKLYQPSDLNVIKMNDVGTGMLEDDLFVRGDWIKDKDNQETAKKFLAASFKGWIYCRDHVDECTQIVVKNGPTLGKGHQKWMMNEINALIWPAPKGIGVMDKAAYQRTAKIAQDFGVIKKAPTADAYRTDLAQDAVDEVSAEGMDVNGEDYKKANVAVTPKGA